MGLGKPSLALMRPDMPLGEIRRRAVPLQNSIRARTPSIVSHLIMERLRELRIDWKKSVLMGMSDYAGLGIRGD
jgi:hypothetical protein